jgi:DNA-directed RNA polymerase specialized sigma24 family protein
MLATVPRAGAGTGRGVVSEGSRRLRVVPSAEDDAFGHFDRDSVLAAVAALPLRQRACVVMRHWMRMTEIAESLELSVGSVRTHVKRGTESLKASLGDQR